jgi:spore germination cell wall hydrolase CwlJ-like protein
MSTLILFAMLLCGEASGEGIEGMRLVASTVLNRAEAWHKPIRTVITQPRQYYGLKSGLWDKCPQKIKEQALQVAKEALEGRIIDKTDGALFFINPKHEKPFKWCKVLTYTYKNHAFYK